MKGWLLVNGFLYSSAQSEKFAELYGYLQNAAKGCGVELEIRYTSDVLCDLQNDERLQDKPDFVLFWDKDVLAAKRLERLIKWLYSCPEQTKKLRILIIDDEIRVKKVFLDGELMVENA